VQELKKPLRVTFLSEDGRVSEEGVDQGNALILGQLTPPERMPGPTCNSPPSLHCIHMVMPLATPSTCACASPCLFMLCVQELKKPLRVTFLWEDGRVPEGGVDQGRLLILLRPACLRCMCRS
jgi:hypothetical protein